MYGAGGAVTYEHPDHLSTRVEADANGAVTRTFGHFPFGEVWYETGTASKWKFTTYERDPESGLDYADFRFYSSRLGRFMSRDLLAGRIWNPQSLDRYSYVLGDPMSLVDPLGLDSGYPILIIIPPDPLDPAGGGLGGGPIHIAQLLDDSGGPNGGGGHVGGGGADKGQKSSKADQCAAIERARAQALHDQRNRNLERMAAAFVIGGLVCVATDGSGCLLIAFGAADMIGLDMKIDSNYGYDAINADFDAQAKAAGCTP